MQTQIDTMRVGMAELKAQNETTRVQNTEQRMSFTTAMSNLRGILINMGVTNPKMINHQFLSGGSLSNQPPSSLYAQRNYNSLPPYGQHQQPGSFGQLFEMTYAQAQLYDQPSSFAVNGCPQPPSSNPHIATTHLKAGQTHATPLVPVR
ncbi:unnamed protein product, partial [Cuscuta epithymum]